MKWDNTIWSGMITENSGTILDLKILYRHHWISDIKIFWNYSKQAYTNLNEINHTINHTISYNAVFTFWMIISFNLFQLQKSH